MTGMDSLCLRPLMVFCHAFLQSFAFTTRALETSADPKMTRKQSDRLLVQSLPMGFWRVRGVVGMKENYSNPRSLNRGLGTKRLGVGFRDL